MTSPRVLLVRDVMTRDVATVSPDDKLIVADDLMRLGRIRHLPVVDQRGVLVGILTHRDLFHSALLRALGYGFRAKQQALESLSVKDAMHTELQCTSPDATLKAAAELMLAQKIGCLPALEHDKLVGIVTESDFVRWVAEGRELFAT